MMVGLHLRPLTRGTALSQRISPSRARLRPCRRTSAAPTRFCGFIDVRLVRSIFLRVISSALAQVAPR